MSAVEAVLALCLPGVIPAVALSGMEPATLFLIPLAGAVMAALAAILEFGVTGSLVGWFIPIAIVANLASAVYLVRRRPRRRASGPSPLWQPVGLAVVLAGVSWPLLALQVPNIGFDAHATWMVHTALIWNGHQAMTRLASPYYTLSSNSSYPPLVPAAGALGYAASGHLSERLAVAITVLLNASAVGLVGTGLLRTVPPGAPRNRRLGAMVVAFLFCGAVFGIAGIYATNGYADLLWSAGALAATVYGLVLPREWRNLAVAWLALLVASLTKDEGFLVGIAISLLIAARYAWPVAAPRVRWLLQFGAMAVGPLIPAAVWFALIHEKGISSGYFGSGGTEALSMRLAATSVTVSHQLYGGVAALIVLVLGALRLRQRRSGLGLANPAWLWTAALAGLALVGATYVLGAIPIHWWLWTSIDRSTIFVQMVFLAGMTLWMLVLLSAVPSPALHRSTTAPLSPPLVRRPESASATP